MQFSQDQKEHKVQLAQGSAIVRLVDIGPQDKKWAKGIFAPDSGEVSNQATFVWPDDSGSFDLHEVCLLYTSPSPRDRTRSRMPSSA